MTTGRIDTDYKPEKPAADYLSLRTEITVRCPEGGNTDCEHANQLAARAAEQYREQVRLERAVVEAAKAFTDDTERREQWDVLVAYRELCGAVDALLEFESKQDQK